MVPHKNISDNFSNSQIPSLILPNQSIANSQLEKCQSFCSISKNNSTLNDLNVPHPAVLLPSHSKAMPSPIISIVGSLSTQDIDKTYGSNGVPLRVLRACVSESSPVFSKLFRLLMKHLETPDHKYGPRRERYTGYPLSYVTSVTPPLLGILENL